MRNCPPKPAEWQERPKSGLVGVFRGLSSYHGEGPPVNVTGAVTARNRGGSVSFNFRVQHLKYCVSFSNYCVRKFTDVDYVTFPVYICIREAYNLELGGGTYTHPQNLENRNNRPGKGYPVGVWREPHSLRDIRRPGTAGRDIRRDRQRPANREGRKPCDQLEVDALEAVPLRCEALRTASPANPCALRKRPERSAGGSAFY